MKKNNSFKLKDGRTIQQAIISYTFVYKVL